MIVAKKTLGNQGVLNKEVIKWAIESETELCVVNRPLTMNRKSSDLKIVEFIDDITSEEIQAGTLAVKEYCTNNNCIELYYEYVLATSDSEIEKLNIYKDMKKAEIESSKNESISKTVELRDKRFKPNDGDISLINSILSTYSGTKELPSDFKWISEDNEQVELTYDELKSLGESYLNNLTNSTIRARVLKDLIIKAKTKEQLDNIRWEE